MNPVQEVILSIFKEVAKICNEHNIPYYAIGGTCIGAIRHKGFIPWDDDLDIAIPIEYWDSFIRLAKEKLPDNLYLYTSDNVRHYHYMWLKVCDKNTTFIEKSEYKLEDAWKGVFIDIMPLGGFPKEDRNIAKYIKKLALFETLNNCIRFPKTVNSTKSLIRYMMYSIFLRILPFNYYSRKYIDLLKNYPLKTSEKTGYVWHPHWLPRLIFPVSVFGSGVEIDFEDTKIRVPSQYHDYLSQQFGNYMVIPSKENQQQHDGFVDVDRPYSYYYGKDWGKCLN